jgi:CheY-like chemotaxis protein
MGKRVLAIDDEKVMLRLVKAILSRAGYDVVTNESIEEALVTLQGQSFDLITCDLMLPGISGLDFLRMLKDGEVQPRLPVIVVTAAGFQSELEQARAMGAADVLNKPFTSQQLIAVVETAFANSPSN